jgi:hypothetical protein
MADDSPRRFTDYYAVMPTSTAKPASSEARKTLPLAMSVALFTRRPIGSRARHYQRWLRQLILILPDFRRRALGGLSNAHRSFLYHWLRVCTLTLKFG